MSGSRQSGSNDVKIINPKNILREKVGYGGLPAATLEKAEDVIKEDSKAIDYATYAREFLARLETATNDVRDASRRDKKYIQAITRPVMELKASGGMFGHALVTEVADVILDFLERLDTLNDDAIEIIDIHYTTLNTIIASGLKGDGGSSGLALSRELYGACQRYYKKYPESQND